MPVGRAVSRPTWATSTPWAPMVSTRWSPKPSAPTRLTQRAECPAAASAHRTLDSAPPMARSKDGTSARRPGREGRNVTMDSPSAATSTTSGPLQGPVAVTMLVAPRYGGGGMRGFSLTSRGRDVRQH
ncbi:hypothetical protein CF54_02490 [Streptomyces sp. Tu 6176]|nr:hypothetical protein CF54_02490 [Streptomyces sp. Tu 6176]